METSFSCRALGRIALLLAILLLAALLTMGSLQTLKASNAFLLESLPTISSIDESSLQATPALSQNVEPISQIGGPMNTVATQGNLAYVGIGPSLVILDVSNPAHPTRTGQTSPMPDVVSGVTVSGTYAYIADHYGGLRVIDVSDPSRPYETGYYRAWDAVAQGVAISGSMAYIASVKGLHTIDVSDPAQPQQLGFASTSKTALNVAVAGNHAFVAAEDAGLRIMDVSNPANPHEVGFFDSPCTFDVVVAGNYAYLAGCSSGLKIVNIANPPSPTLVGRLNTIMGTTLSVVVKNDYAYMVDWYHLSIIDISVPMTPTETAVCDLTGYTGDVAIAGDYTYITAKAGGLHVINTSNPASPYEIGFYKTSLISPSSVAVAGAFAYITEGDPYGYGPRGLRIVNVSDPLHPFTVSTLDTPGRARDVAVSGPYVYIADDNAGLRIINALYATNPMEISAVDMPGPALGVAVSGDYAYVADGSGGLRIIKVRDPAAPSNMGAYVTSGNAQDVAIAGSIAYVAYGSAGLQIINVADPSNPTKLGSRHTLDDAQGVAVAGGYAYVAAGAGGLRIITVTDPIQPSEVGFITLSDSAHDVAVTPDGLAYVAAGNGGGLHVINVTSPTHPIEVGFYQTPGNADGVAVADSLAFLASGDGGMMILHYHPGPPTASFIAYPTSGRRPLTVVFTGTLADGADAWLWTFGDGITSALSSPTHTYAAAGVYTVSLRVSNVNGSDTLTRTNYITVTGVAFTADPTFGRPPLMVTFTNQSMGNYTSSLWDFGDGITSTVTNPAHTYTALGVYTVTLTVSGPDGDDTESKPAFIAALEPIAYLPLIMRDYAPDQLSH